MEKVGLIPVDLAETEAYQIALDHRLDLLNEIDTFEDRKRQIKVAANNLNPDLNLFSTVSLQSDPTDYAKFNLNDYSLSGGLQLDLPVNRLLQRNSYRRALVDFEVQIRTLSLFLDNLKNDVRGGLRSLEQARQSYEIQKSARDLADRRVENSEMLLQAGRAQTRDVLEAQNARVSAYNAVTAAIVDYHLTRLQLLLNMGVLRTEEGSFWLKEGAVAKQAPPSNRPKPEAQSKELVTPEQLFEK
jgi:outer membrane protein TolC